MTVNQEMFAAWLSDPRHANHPDRHLLQRAHDAQAGGPTVGTEGQSEEAALAAQVLASIGRTPAKAVAEPRTEAELAAQIVALRNPKKR